MTLYYKKPSDNDYTTTPMASGSDTFTAQIPGSSVVSPNATYYIEAKDAEGNTALEPQDGSTNPHEIPVSPPPPPGAPNITLISPQDGPPDGSFTITGSNFGSNQGTVSVGPGSPTITSWSDTVIQINLVTGTPTGTHPVKVTDNPPAPQLPQESNAWNITVRPDITTISPTSGARGLTVITLSTTSLSFGFSGDVKIKHLFTGNTVSGVIYSWQPHEIQVALPFVEDIGASKVFVVDSNGISSNEMDFTVNP